MHIEHYFRCFHAWCSWCPHLIVLELRRLIIGGRGEALFPEVRHSRTGLIQLLSGRRQCRRNISCQLTRIFGFPRLLAKGPDCFRRRGDECLVFNEQNAPFPHPDKYLIRSCSIGEGLSYFSHSLMHFI